MNAWSFTDYPVLHVFTVNRPGIRMPTTRALYGSVRLSAVRVTNLEATPVSGVRRLDHYPETDVQVSR